VEKISAVVLTKNEEKNIAGCLDSLKFCDELIVVDDNSKDATRKIARKFGAKIFVRDMNKDFAGQSNFGMKMAKCEWIIFLDADERISKDLANEIKERINDAKSDAFIVKRLDFIWGRWLTHGEVGSFKNFRVVKKNIGFWERRVHPKFILNKGARIGYLKNPIKHYPHQNLSDFLQSLDRWSSWHALANKEEGKKSSSVKIILFPLAHFFKNYLLKLGLLDGIHGFVFAVVMSFHSFLSWSKLWISEKGT